jgi:thiamine kinase-like enzyme
MHRALSTAIDTLRQNDHLPVMVSRLRGGITNETFRVDIGESAYVVSIDSGSAAVLGINRDVEYHNSRLAVQYNIGPQVICRTGDAIITHFIDGKNLEPGDLAVQENMTLVVGTLQRCHRIPVSRVKGTYNVFHAVSQHLRKIKHIRRKSTIQFERSQAIWAKIYQALNNQAHNPVLCHNDTVPENMILTNNGLILVDWEYSGVGDRFFDLGMLAAYHELDASQERLLIETYFGELYSGALARLRLMRAMSDLRDATWGIVQAQYSTLEFDFENYSMKRFQRFESLTSNPGFKKSLNVAASKARLSTLRKE